MPPVLSLPGIRRGVPLAPFTTYKIGGPADYFVEVTASDQLRRAVLAARSQRMPYFILGTGANILVSDKGFRGLVIRNRADHIAVHEASVSAGSGATVAELIEQTAAAGLSGLEHFVGIPSTVGGAIWQNLHFLAPNRTDTVYIGDILESAEVLLADGQVHQADREFFEFGYDDSRLHHEEVVVLSATFRLEPKPETKIREQMESNLAWRQAKQPQLDEYPSCGSVFKKIEGVGAGRLIDAECGLKGTRMGDAEVSHQHANYFVNLGHATAADVKKLIDFVHEQVLQQTGHDLQLEISLVGEW